MAVHKRAYRPYEGPLTPERRRVLVLPRYAFLELFESRVLLSFFVLCFVPFLVELAIVYVALWQAYMTYAAAPFYGEPALTVGLKVLASALLFALGVAAIAFVVGIVVYFLDPAGNILEFIARHTLKNEAPADRAFSEHDILCASEIGIVAPDVVETADQLCEAVKIERYHGGDENFTAAGDEHGLFIVVKTGRRWFSSDRAAAVFAGEVTVRGEHPTARTRLPTSEFAVVAEKEVE